VTRSTIAVAFAALVSAGACAGSTPVPTRLAVALYPQGLGGPVQQYTLSCGPAAGTVPKPAEACRVLLGLEHPFAPTPAGTTCTQIALGPNVAIVSGHVRGVPVYARLRVQNGCEIARWGRISAVVPGFPGKP
jgi:hypothetical protein